MKCSTPYCRNRTERCGKSHRKKCPKCRAKDYKKKHPFRYYFNAHKCNAKRRGIPWHLSFEEFQQIWKQSGKWKQKLSGQLWEMHRLDPDKGYKINNIVIIKKSLHVEITNIERRWHVEFKYRPTNQTGSSSIEEAPF